MSDVLVLCYHAVSPSWPAALSIPPEALERQLSQLARRGYRGVTVAEALTAPPAERTVAISFDDAYRSVLELARPVLDRLGMRASVYVATDWPGRDAPMSWPGIEQWLGGPHQSELRCMTWAELGGLADHGWEVGSHTCSHPRLPELDDRALDAELQASRAECETRMGRACHSIAYPYGAVDERVVEAAGRAGYRFGVTLPHRLHAPRPLHWPRVGIYNVDAQAGWRFRLKVSPVVRTLRGSPAWGALERSRRGTGALGRGR